jgi:glycosyltransferase involved in cell wall biosynthesis
VKFSVLMSVYFKDDAAHLDRALRSIHNDQILKPLEIILILDGTIGVELNEVIIKYKKALGGLLIVAGYSSNKGLAHALNFGLNICNFDLVARMDADDISLPNRFKLQIDFMRSNPDIAACGSYLGEFNDESENITKIVKLPLSNKDILKFIQLRTPIGHPVAMLRKTMIQEVGGYPALPIGQDIALWSILLARGYRLANIPEALLKIRVDDDFYTRRSWNAFKSTIEVSKLQYNEGLISKTIFLRNIILRLILRMSPVALKKLAYKFLRK